jgi:hypothetical protein
VPDLDDPRIDRIRRMPIDAPAPWRALGRVTVGGLRGVGFDEASELLLVESTDGKGVFDCATGERVARDPDADSTFDEEVRLQSKGIGPLAGRTIRVCGLFGGGLPLMTLDGWSVELVHHSWPHVASLVLVPSGASVWDPAQARNCAKLAETEAPLAYGFSHTGQSLILAHSHTLEIWTRA